MLSTVIYIASGVVWFSWALIVVFFAAFREAQVQQPQSAFIDFPRKGRGNA